MGFNMKPTTLINRIGLFILLPSFVALLFLCYKLTPGVSPGSDIDKLLNWAGFISLLTVVGFEMFFHRSKTRKN